LGSRGSLGAEGEFDEEAGAAIAIEGDVAADGFDAFAHAAEAVAFAGEGMLAVVFYDEAAVALL